MKFRPCIDIHNGKVKQIVGGSLRDAGDRRKRISRQIRETDYLRKMYKKGRTERGTCHSPESGIVGILRTDKKQALKALHAYPGGLQIGGGITADNASEYIRAGASHVIVTSYVFKNGEIYWDNLKKLCMAVGKEHVVLDLSCRKKDGRYYIVTDRWQTFTNVELGTEILGRLSGYCDEFLVHGVDVEGKASGIEQELIEILKQADIPVTYAGGIGSMEDMEQIRRTGNGKVDFTIGSALDLFGGRIPYEVIKEYH